jgi:hypothetical protein
MMQLSLELDVFWILMKLIKLTIMKNKISTLFILFLIFSSFSLQGQTRDIGDFHALSASTSVNVTLVKASAPSIEYTMKKGNDKNLVTEVKNGVLYVKTTSDTGDWGNNTKADVTVYYTNLDEVKASAGCTVKTKEAIVADRMEIEVSSGSSAELEVRAETIEVDASSGATLNLKGEAGKGDFEASSGSTLNAYYFEAENADVEANSGASVSIHVNDTLDAEAGSGGSISYTGDVKSKKIDAGWSGSIKRKN